MVSEPEALPNPVAAENQIRLWRPSRRPDHLNPPGLEGQVLVRMQPDQGGVLRVLLRYLTMPSVKVLIGVSLFVVGAIVFDATINGGAWTERAEKPKATRHR